MPPPKSSPAKLNVVMYKPRQGNYDHWALHLEDGHSNIIYEVVGQHPNFEKHSVKARPQNSINFKHSFQVGEINADDIPSFTDEVSKAKVDNTTVHWNCQDYVIEIVEKLVEECIIDEDDYKKVERQIKRHFGARV
ncbi:hypothetical protein DV738_g1922, partial [Chaetothyriales sp. CBS 135597]